MGNFILGFFIGGFMGMVLTAFIKAGKDDR